MKKEFEDELREISPFLADLKKSREGEEPFRTPKFYFDTLADKVIEKAVAKPVIPPHLSPWEYSIHSARPSLIELAQTWIASIIQPRYAIGFATVALLTVGGWFFIQNNQQNVDYFASNEEIHQYITDNIDDFDEALLLEQGILADSDVLNPEQSLKGNIDKINATDDEIEQYLKEHLDEKDLKELQNEL